MLSYAEYLNIPAKIVFILVAILLFIQLVGEFLEFRGKVVPEFFKIRKHFAKKKHEREVIAKVPETLKKVEDLLNDVNQHYSKDNIAKRDSWMDWVNEREKAHDTGILDLEKKMINLEEKMDENNKITLSLLIETKRNLIIDFASKVVDENYPVTREQFNRVIKVYKEYEDIIERNLLENGEVDIAIRIIEESYETHMKNHSFVENIRGYDQS